ncbi:hypothetical protein K490DRAFT_62891 [Saccharata proteae CBS 121410]|uniref:Uncharacterized protein n=1 Tax=Saccharata proteae CBS 121410 TaxID=1314787 RepID=A0A9P4I0M3_9PEZI|nr:hypothetical protein K490DRAFT_62891 [Saccharata proteae CBS 121410]
MFFPLALCALPLITSSVDAAAYARYRHAAFETPENRQILEHILPLNVSGFLGQLNQTISNATRGLAPALPQTPTAELPFVTGLAPTGISHDKEKRDAAADLPDKRQFASPIDPFNPGPVIISTLPPVLTSHTVAKTVLGYFTPSPGGIPIPITQQSQVEPTFFPEYTTCDVLSAAFQPARPTGPPYLNYSSIVTSSSTPPCRTIYSSILTTLCTTTLTALASKITVTECAQDVTFSSDFGTELVTPPATRINGTGSRITPVPSVQLQTTYYMANWTDFTSNNGALPTDVDVKVCHPRGDGIMEDCIMMSEAWAVIPITRTTSFTSHIDFTATMTAPGRILVETIALAVMGNTTTVSLSTEAIFEQAYEAETISRVTRTYQPYLSSAASATATSTETRNVELVSMFTSDDGITTTISATSTDTIFAGTTTTTMT